MITSLVDAIHHFKLPRLHVVRFKKEMASAQKSYLKVLKAGLPGMGTGMKLCLLSFSGAVSP